MGYIGTIGVYSRYIGVILRFYRDNGKENRNCSDYRDYLTLT